MDREPGPSPFERKPVNQDFHSQVDALVDNIGKAVVTRPGVVKMAVLGLLCQGHVLLDDFPGVGKTLLSKALAQSLEASFRRVQFTPDLLPTDITGSSIYNPSKSDFEFVAGPIFANVVLADEINRSSPRTQSALLEAMGENQVTFDGVAHRLPKPFFVIATRNLAEAHGTFPLPQAQLDRFLLSFRIGYPTPEEEVTILERHKHGQLPLGPVLSADDIVAMQEHIYQVDVARPVSEYIAAIVAESRNHPELATGVSPRGAVLLQKAAQGNAAMDARSFATPDDVKAVAQAVLQHRVTPRSSDPDAAARSVDAILNAVPIPL